MQRFGVDGDGEWAVPCTPAFRGNFNVHIHSNWTHIWVGEVGGVKRSRVLVNKPTVCVGGYIPQYKNIQRKQYRILHIRFFPWKIHAHNIFLLSYFLGVWIAE